MDESVVIASPSNQFPGFFVMSPGNGKKIHPQGACYQVDETGRFHLKWRINGLYQRTDVYLGPCNEVLARIVEHRKNLTGNEPMLELYKNGKRFKIYFVKDLIQKPELYQAIPAPDLGPDVSVVEFRNLYGAPEFVPLKDLQETSGFYEFPKFNEFKNKIVFTFITFIERQRFVVNIEDGSILARWSANPISKKK